MSHGTKDGKIFAADEEYYIEELWENFLGNNCKSLVGKPKLFFIQADRGTMIDPGVSFKSNQLSNVVDNVEVDSARPISIIPKLSDLLVMYSTAEGHHSFRNPLTGSWFIQTLCEVLKTHPDEEILSILTLVNQKIAYEKQAHFSDNAKFDGAKQMPNIVSMLTKSFFLYSKTENDLTDKQKQLRSSCKERLEDYYDFSNSNRGIALIFNHESFDQYSKRNGTRKDGDDLNEVLTYLQFDVRQHMDLKFNEIKSILSEGESLLNKYEHCFN